MSEISSPPSEPRLARPASLRILIIDDEPSMRAALTLCLEADGHSIVAKATASEAMDEVRRQAFDLIFLDLRLGSDNGLELLPGLLRENPRARVIAMTAYGPVETAVEAMKRGAADYLAKPFTPLEVQLVTQKVAERRRLESEVETLRDALDQLDPEADFPTTDTNTQQAISLAHQVAASNVTVLISGEPGTGKARLARAIHSWSSHANGPLGVALCDATDADAFEADLFGTCDAPDGEHAGRVAFCEGGTLLLEEIGHTPASFQPKLLRLMKEKEYERVGDFRARKADVRFIATTAIDLHDAARQGRFRPELLMALDVIRIDLPPLRRRVEDIKLLARRYFAHYSRENPRLVSSIHPDAMHALCLYTWPGNARELRNVIERAVLLCQGDQLTCEHLPPNLLRGESGYSIGDLVPLETIEGMHIRRVLDTTGTIKGAAAVLGINPSTVARWLRRADGNGNNGSAGTQLSIEP
jgi:NtrC-family two-component system response regulator AlgB